MRSEEKGIIIMGFMGTGKTSVGRVLAKKLLLPFVDLDEEIEQREGESISEIFERRGEAAFRDIERQTLEDVLNEGKAVVATGGGVVLDERNVKGMRSYGKVILLESEPEEIIRRLKGDRSRPLLKGSNMRGRIERIMKEREKFYDFADIRVSSDKRKVDEIADEIVHKLESDRCR